MPLSVKEALDAFQAQNNATDKLWAYFSAVSLAVAGYAVSQSNELNFTDTLAIIIAYAVFCINNNLALGVAQGLLVNLAHVVRSTGASNDILLDVKVLESHTVRLGQGLMAASVIMGVFLLRNFQSS